MKNFENKELTATDTECACATGYVKNGNSCISADAETICTSVQVGKYNAGLCMSPAGEASDAFATCPAMSDTDLNKLQTAYRSTVTKVGVHKTPLTNGAMYYPSLCTAVVKIGIVGNYYALRNNYWGQYGSDTYYSYYSEFDKSVAFLGVLLPLNDD